jgi:pSer/pThr/pTyr-binding forkhead associated (FHA) protein
MLDISARGSDIDRMAMARGAATDVSETIDQKERPEPFGAPHVYVLVVTNGDDPTAIHRIVRQETIIGRGEGAHFIIEDDQVSKAHCRIRVDGSVCTIFDLGSRNGTSLNGRRLAKDSGQRLRHLDEIEVGSHKLLLLAGRFRATPKAVPA